MRFFARPLDFVIFILRSLMFPRDIRRTIYRTIDQIYRLGVGTVPIIVLASIFVGLTTVVQTSYQLLGVVPHYFIGMGVGRMLLIELGPVFSAFIFTSRSASSMAAELGAMRTSDQLDALKVMGIDPYRFLCLPRIFASVVTLPVILVIMEVVAALTAVVVSGWLGVARDTFVYGITHFVHTRDFFGGILKAIVFGLFIGASSCYFGFNCEAGAEGVGRAATRAVVLSGVFILFFDFILAMLVFYR